MSVTDAKNAAQRGTRDSSGQIPRSAVTVSNRFTLAASAKKKKQLRNIRMNKFTMPNGTTAKCFARTVAAKVTRYAILNHIDAQLVDRNKNTS